MKKTTSNKFTFSLHLFLLQQAIISGFQPTLHKQKPFENSLLMKLEAHWFPLRECTSEVHFFFRHLLLSPGLYQLAQEESMAMILLHQESETIKMTPSNIGRECCQREIWLTAQGYPSLLITRRNCPVSQSSTSLLCGRSRKNRVSCNQGTFSAQFTLDIICKSLPSSNETTVREEENDRLPNLFASLNHLSRK